MAEGWKKVGLGLVFSTFLGFVGGLLVVTVIYWLFRKAVPGKSGVSFPLASGLLLGIHGLSHGSNDGQKFMGAFTLALVLGGALRTWFAIPLGAPAGVRGRASLGDSPVRGDLAIGTITGGWRIIRTMGIRITKLETHQGFAAERPPRAHVTLASKLGIPLSTTHTIPCHRGRRRGARGLRRALGRHTPIS